MTHLIKPVQTVIVSKRLYPTEAEAKKYVESIHMNSHFKLHPDSSKNVWRFRQHTPLENAKYFTKTIHGGGKLVIDYSHHTP